MSDDFPDIKFKELLPGAHCAFDVPTMPPLPEEILSLEDTSLRQRASDAWESARSLRAIWSLWAQFVRCGYVGVMPDSTTQSEIAERFPNLAAMGPVLKALAQSKPLRGKRKQDRDLADERAGITRGPTTPMKRGEMRHYRGRGIQELHAAFQRGVRVHIQSLCLIGVLLPDFQRHVDGILFDALAPMAITLDCTGDGPVIDFRKESARLADEGFRQVQSAVFVLLEMLESRPTVVLNSQSVEPQSVEPQSVEPQSVEPQSCQSSADQQLDAKYGDDNQVEDAENEASDSDPDNLPYLSINLDDSSGELSRDGVEAKCYLSRTPTKVAKLLIDAAGAIVKFHGLRSAWPQKGFGITNENIHSLINKLNTEFGKLGLRAKNIRGKGYCLLDAGETG